MHLKINRKKRGSTYILQLAGKLDLMEYLRMPARMSPFCRKKIGPVIIDMTASTSVDSQWLALFIRFNELALQHGNHVNFLIPPGTIRDLFVTTGLHKVIAIINTLDDAFKQSSKHLPDQSR